MERTAFSAGNFLTHLASRVIDKFEEFIRKRYYKQLLERTKKNKKSITIDFNELDRFSHHLSDFAADNFPKAVELFEEAIRLIDLPTEFSKLRVRFENLPEEIFIKISDIRAKELGQLLWIEGIIRQASDVRPVARAIIFECPACGEQIEIEQGFSSVVEPRSCKCGRKGQFTEKEKNLIDTQRITLEENPEKLESGEQPKRLSIFLREDLVDPTMQRRVSPGKKVRVFGYVKEIPLIGRKGQKLARYDLIMEANNIETIDKDYTQLEITNDDIEKIKELSKSSEILEKFAECIAPTIYGYAKIKQALVLQLFGGVKKTRGDSTSSRGDIHILMVGDPGTGKSQMLKNIAAISPKAVFAIGTATSGAGLTAAVMKDEFLAGWTLEAGSIVLANNGLLCIDEIDKMNKDDRVAMHEGLEQQTITINKANVHATLKAEASVLAAANPRLGRFDPYKSVAEQIDLPPPLINRFDLIFITKDRPTPEHDEKVATHILESHMNPEEKKSSIDYEMLRKYIAYARRNCMPKMTDSASRTINDYYVNLRNSTSSESERRSIPINARQLEGIIRLSEACAKLELKEKVTREHAEKAIWLFKCSMGMVGVDIETGEFDIDIMISGISSLQRNRIHTIETIMSELEAENESKLIETDKLFDEAEKKGIERNKAEELIDKMKRSGQVFEPSHGHIKKVS